MAWVMPCLLSLVCTIILICRLSSCTPQTNSCHQPPVQRNAQGQIVQSWENMLTAGSSQLPASFQLAPVLPACSGRHHYECICIWPLPLHKHLQLATAAECMHPTIFGHHCSLSCSLAIEPGHAAEKSKGPCSHSAIDPQCSPRTMWLLL